MKNIKNLSLICFLAFFLVQCKSSQVSKEPVVYLTKEEANSKFTTEQLAQGKAIWQQKCQKCHKLIQPEAYNAQKWKSILDKMVPKAKLEETDAQLVRAFMAANAK